MSTDTYNIQNNVMSVNEWITELDGKFNAEEYNTLPEHIEYCSIQSPMAGLHHTLETRKKLSEAATGRKLSEETKKKIGNIHRGKITSQETKKKMSENNSRHFSGKKHSPETRKKISENNKRAMAGKKHSPETIKKMSETAKLRMRNNNGKFTSE